MQGGTANKPSPEDTPPSREKDHRGGGRDWLVPAAIIGGVAALAAITALLTQKSPGPKGDSPTEPPNRDLVEQLKKTGPQFPYQFNMSAFAVRGLLKGGWPLVIDFEQGSPGTVRLVISAQGVPEVFAFLLSRDQRERRRMILPLPPQLGDEPRAALIAVMATDGKHQETVAPFSVYGFGAGPRAVGSVAIDQVLFRPSDIHVAQGDTAAYRFYSHSDFDNVSVEFMKVWSRTDGSAHLLVNSEFIGEGIGKNCWIGDPERRDWDGFDRERQISNGSHKLQIRAWDQVGDWVTAWSEALVHVSQ